VEPDEASAQTSDKCIVVRLAVSGARLCEVPVSDSLTVEDARKLVKQHARIDCRIEFLYKAVKLSNNDALLTDLLDFDEYNSADVQLVKVKEIVFDTRDDGIYQRPLDVQLLSEGPLTYLIFSISGASNDAHVGLFPGAVDIGRPFYEFVIDGWGGYMSGIRRGRGAMTMTEAYGAQLDARNVREFWVSVDSSTGEIAMGRGTDITQQKLMSFTDSAVLSPVSVGVMTKHGACATWTFNT
jgi:hypothetical protein